MRVFGYAVQYKTWHLKCFLLRRKVVMLRVLFPNVHCQHVLLTSVNLFAHVFMQKDLFYNH